MKKKMETSKLIVLVTGIIFAVSVTVCLLIFMYCTIFNMGYDWTGMVALLGVTGSVFGTAIATYEAKAKVENTLKIKRSFLEEKYDTLNKIGVLNCMRAQMEFESEVGQIDQYLNMKEEEGYTDPTYQQIM
jgi:hypothetical protein